MSRLKKDERRHLLIEKLNTSPFATDEELATYFKVSVPTIRLDRLALGIPELRERIKAMAKEHSDDRHEQESQRIELIGDLLDHSLGEYGISLLETTDHMLDSSGYVEPQYLYGQANSLARVVVGSPAIIAGVGNIKYKSPVKGQTKLIAKAEIVRKRGDKIFVWVTIKEKIREVFRAKFIMESIKE